MCNGNDVPYFKQYPIDQYLDIEPEEFEKEILIAYAVCGKECGHKEFIVDGQTQVCKICHKQMFRTEVKRYILVEQDVNKR